MDLDTETQGVAKDGSNTQGVYIYRPVTSAKAHGERPSKRRKVQPEIKEQKSESHPFVPLLDGEENESSVELRYNAYRLLWSTQETKIQEILDDVDSEVLENVLSFVRSTSHLTYDGCIPTALITVGSNVSSLGRLLSKLNDQLAASEEGGVVILESGDAPNLKATLKNIIRAAVTNTEGNNGYQNFLTDREGPRLLGYDLDLLGDYVKRKGIKKLVVAFRDSEAFDPNILTDLLSLLRFCEHLLDDDSTEQVRSLLENDEFLFQQSLKYIEIGQQRMRSIFHVVKTVYLCLKSMDIRKKLTIPDLSIRALSGDLQDSTYMDDLLKGLKTLDSSKLKEVLAFMPQDLTDCPDFQEIKKDFEALVQTYQGTEPLRSEYDSHNSIVAATVVQQRVKLSKSKARLPQQNIEYTKVIDRVYALSEKYFVETLVRPQDLFLHEAFLLDMKNPLKEIFSPRPRFAIERALANPFDYLMSMSDRTEARISARQPATAILYQLYLESGALVNVYDLWQAFYAVFESEQGDACDERMTMTLFYRAVSELKALGMLKSSRKKVDHASKSAWIGL
ncbi:Origin recognition complex, subunit 3 [Aspergillus oryzae]|uniref:Origin recognition complex, subunit 3 n=1 Tax=Aspergillus oryzae TaxID=5062 RepID=A0A1S9DFU3_ASPOZ|nr:uncharacterized protein G4B84_011637 [Aspergillus flavus NRRL3357]OOO07937.1 Origin recognition complex, subunit 3 [Aspergillus oryzae]QMW36108.1 hypothetical protein G4B84_011637 [Aspergillus flavus NRRL3357]QMW48168.1 hypothetical protein G4B11_011686 [Aspergillus flavus]